MRHNIHKLAAVFVIDTIALNLVVGTAISVCIFHDLNLMVSCELVQFLFQRLKLDNMILIILNGKI